MQFLQNYVSTTVMTKEFAVKVARTGAMIALEKGLELGGNMMIPGLGTGVKYTIKGIKFYNNYQSGNVIGMATSLVAPAGSRVVGRMSRIAARVSESNIIGNAGSMVLRSGKEILKAGERDGFAKAVARIKEQEGYQNWLRLKDNPVYREKAKLPQYQEPKTSRKKKYIDGKLLCMIGTIIHLVSKKTNKKLERNIKKI